MTLSHRVWVAIVALFVAAAVTFGAAWIGYQSARADDAGLAAPAPVVGSAALEEPAPAATPAPTALQPSDVAVATKLYKGGAFFALGILVVFVGLSVWSKLDRKHAFYIATGLGGVGLLVESIRKGDTPNALSVSTMLMTTVGIMIAGPGHVKAPAG